MKKAAIILSALACSIVGATVVYPPAKYGQQLTIHFSLYDSNSPWQFYETAPAADDVYVRKDGGAAARATNAVTDLNHTMSIVLTATEMQAAIVTIDVNDESSPALFGSETIIIPTTGHASAYQAFDLDDATPPVDVTTWDGNDLTQYAYNTTTKMLNVDVNYVRESNPISNPGGDTLAGTFNDCLYAAYNAGLADAASPWKKINDYLTGDAFARSGAPAGASISADIASVSSSLSSLTITGAPQVLTYGALQSATASTATLASDANSTTDYYCAEPTILVITGGKGTGQARLIQSQAGVVLTLYQNWKVIPDSTSTYQIQATFEDKKPRRR